MDLMSQKLDSRRLMYSSIGNSISYLMSCRGKMHLTTQDFDNHYKYESKKTRVMDLIHLDIFENFIVEKGHQ
jgi:hypothetical protein